MCACECKTIYLVLSHFVLFCTVVCVSHLLFFSLFPFWCLPHFWQFARHGDKISEKKEQNVRLENASFVSVIMVVFKLFSHPFSPHERIMQYALSFQFVLFTKIL